MDRPSTSTRLGSRRWHFMLASALLAFLTAVPALPVFAEQGWVKGEVILNVRSGPGNEFRILSTVKTGQPLEILARGDKWTQVRMSNGKQGWLRAGYLDPTPPPRIRLGHLETQVEELTQKLDETETEAGKLRESNQGLTKADTGQRAQIESLTRENIELRAGARWPEWITGALILSTGMVLGALLRSLSGRNRRQRIKL